MNCRKAYDYIIRYFDNKLNDFEDLDLRQHLRLCKKCRNTFEEMGKVLDFVKTNILEPPQDFESKVMSKIYSIKSANKKRGNIIALFYGLYNLYFVFEMFIRSCGIPKCRIFFIAI